MPEVETWHNDAFAARLEATRLAEQLDRPRRLQGIHVEDLFRNARQQLDREHQVAAQLELGTPKSTEPQPLPEGCQLSLRQLLTVSVAGPFKVDIAGHGFVS